MYTHIVADKKISTKVYTIRFTSISVLASFLDKYPVLREIFDSSKSDKPSDDWNYFMTAAGCGLILMSNEDYKGEHKEVMKTCVKIDKNLPRAIDDFIKFMSKYDGTDEGYIANIGLWVLWNIKQAQPTHEDMKELAPVIGNFLLRIF